MTEHEIETVVVGAGPAGLAVGACLRKAGRAHVILEREPRVAPAWSRHYDRLHLHTDKRNSGLPFAPWPSSARLPPKVADALNRPLIRLLMGNVEKLGLSRPRGAALPP